MTRIWIDVDALFANSSIEVCPPGVLRVVLEISYALHTCAPDQIGFVRRKGGAQDWICVSWSDLQSLPAVARHRTGALHVTGQQTVSRKLVKDWVGRDSPHAGGVAEVLKTQLQVLRVGLEWFGAASHYGMQKWQNDRARWAALSRTSHVTAQRHRPSFLSGSLLKELARPGDFFLALVPTWDQPEYSQTVRWLRDVLRVRFSLFIHDLLPVRRPEWFTKNKITYYGAWHQTVLPLVDQIFVNSAATADDVAEYLAEIERPLLRPIVTVPLGSGPAASGATLSRQASGRIVPDGEYVLCVGTLEPRKNHELLLRVWRRLLQNQHGTAIPKLVFVGHVGWLVSDLMQQLENSDWLNGHVQLVSAPSDEQLGLLYRNCLFTVVPSLAEGWSLPVMESLHYGKPCLASRALAEHVDNRGLIRHFDPLNLHDALQVIRNAIEDRDDLKQWTGEVRSRFIPVPWRQSAETILRHTG